MKSTLNFVKIFLAMSWVISFFLLTIAGTRVNDLITVHMTGQTSIVNALGAFGTTLSALGLVVFSTTMAIGMISIMKETKKLSGQWLLGCVIAIVSIFVLSYSLTVAVNSFEFIRGAYNCEIYGFDTIIACVSEALHSNTFLITSAAVLLVFIASFSPKVRIFKIA